MHGEVRRRPQQLRPRHPLDHRVCGADEAGAALGRVAHLAETTDPALHSERQWEIHAWLQAHPRVRRWVALDDEELIEGQPNAARAAEFVGHAVRTESHVGLTDADAELAISLLARQPV